MPVGVLSLELLVGVTGRVCKKKEVSGYMQQIRLEYIRLMSFYFMTSSLDHAVMQPSQ